MDIHEVNRLALVSIIRDFETSLGVPTALAHAVRYAVIDEIERLIVNGADVNAKTTDGLTPLMYAVQPRVAKILLAHGADPNAQDSEGRTPLIWFLSGLSTPAKAEAFVRLLLKSGARSDIAPIDGASAIELAQAKYGARVAGLLTRSDEAAEYSPKS